MPNTKDQAAPRRRCKECNAPSKGEHCHQCEQAIKSRRESGKKYAKKHRDTWGDV